MSLEWSSNSVHELISKLHFLKYLKHKLSLNLIKSLFYFERQGNNQPSCSFSQVTVLNQHKKHQEPKGGFLIKSGLMRLQAGGSNLSPEKSEATPQICKQAQEQGANSRNQYFFKPHLLLLPPAPPHSTFQTLVCLKGSVPFLLPKNMSFRLFFLFFFLSQQCAPKTNRWDRAKHEEAPRQRSEPEVRAPPIGGEGCPHRRAAWSEDSVPAGGSLACGGRVWVGWGGRPCEGQPGVKYQSPGPVEDIPPGIRGQKWNRRLGT